MSLAHLTPLKLWNLLKRNGELPTLTVPTRDLERLIKAMKQCKYREVRYQKSVGMYQFSRLKILKSTNKDNPTYTNVIFKVVDFYQIDEGL